MLLPACLQTVTMKLPFREILPVLLWFRVIVMISFLFHAMYFLVPLPLPISLLAFALLCGFVAMAPSLLGMVNMDVLRLPCSPLPDISTML
jgi:hypothetical protein